MTFSDVLAALAVVLNGLPQALLALSYGFAALPTSLAFAVGTAGALIFKTVTPISFQAETIVMAGSLSDKREERLSMILWTGLLMAVIGALGLLTPTIDFIGPSILNAMMAGVGIILAKVGIDMTKANPVVGSVSIASALLIHTITGDLVYTIVGSVILSSLAAILRKNNKEVESGNLAHEKFQFIKPIMNKRVFRGILALTTLTIGGNIAYGSITASIASSTANIDHLTLYSGLASSLSAAFGGGPVEAVISGTAAAPNPMLSGILMMVIMGIILILGLLPKLAKYVPSQSIAGFLLVLGAIVVFPTNMEIAFEGNSIIASGTTIVTAAIDPFAGMLAGVVLRALLMITGGI